VQTLLETFEKRAYDGKDRLWAPYRIQEGQQPEAFKAAYADLSAATKQNPAGGGLSTGHVVTIGGGGLSFGGTYVFGDGIETAPSVAIGEADSGFWQPADGSLALSLDGTKKIDWTSTHQKLAAGYKLYIGATQDNVAGASEDYIAINQSLNANALVSIKNTNTGTLAGSAFTAISDEDNGCYAGINNTTLSASGLHNTPGAGVVGLAYFGSSTGPGNRSLIVVNVLDDANSHLLFGTRDTERMSIRENGDVRIAYLTAGSVLFGGSSGKINQDNSNLFWDDTNNRLGVGAGTSPAFKLDVRGGTTTLHFTETANNEGGYLVSTSPAQAIMVAGAYWTGSQYTAVATGALNFGAPAISNGDFWIANATGLTPGNPVTFTTRMYMNTSGHFGVNAGTTPRRRFDILDDTNPQLRLTHTDNVDYVDFQVDTSGNLTVNVSGSKVVFNDAVEIDGNIDHDGSNIGVFGAAGAGQGAHIEDADGTLADITTKFNTVLARLEGWGWNASS